MLRCYDRVTPASSPVVVAIATTLSSGTSGGGDGRQRRRGAPPRPCPPLSAGLHPTAIVGVWWWRRRRAVLGSHPARLPSRVHHVAPRPTRCWWRPPWPRPPAAKRGSLAGNARGVTGPVGANQGPRMGFLVAARLWRGRRRGGHGGGRWRVTNASVGRGRECLKGREWAGAARVRRSRRDWAPGWTREAWEGERAAGRH